MSGYMIYRFFDAIFIKGLPFTAVLLVFLGVTAFYYLDKHESRRRRKSEARDSKSKIYNPSDFIPNQCVALTKKGNRCKNKAQKGESYCRAHAQQAKKSQYNSSVQRSTKTTYEDDDSAT